MKILMCWCSRSNSNWWQTFFLKLDLIHTLLRSNTKLTTLPTLCITGKLGKCVFLNWNYYDYWAVDGILNTDLFKANEECTHTSDTQTTKPWWLIDLEKQECIPVGCVPPAQWPSGGGRKDWEKYILYEFCKIFDILKKFFFEKKKLN